MYGARKLDRLVCFRPAYPTPLRLTFPITEQTHLEEFLARSAMGSDVFILFIIISMEESVSYSACFLTISLLISFPLHDAQESSRMRKLRIWGMSGEKMDGMVAIRWTSDRIRYRKRSRYFARRSGIKPDLRRLLSLEIIKILGRISLVTKYLLLFLLWILSEGLRNGNHPIHPLAVHSSITN